MTTQMLRRHVGKSTNPNRLNGIVVTAASLIMLAAMLGPIFSVAPYWPSGSSAAWYWPRAWSSTSTCRSGWICFAKW